MATDYFNYSSVAQEAGISAADVQRLEAVVREDYPADEMMFELRMLRMCSAIRDGVANVEQVIQESYSSAV